MEVIPYYRHQAIPLTHGGGGFAGALMSVVPSLFS